MTNYVLKAETGYIKMTPFGFYFYSKCFFNTEDRIKEDINKFGPVNYFLLCKSIELSLKSYLLYNGKNIKELKKIGHNLVELADESGKISKSIITINISDKKILEMANNFYDIKGDDSKSFEYFNVGLVVNGFKQSAVNKTKMPDIKNLRKIAKKIIEILKENMSPDKESLIMSKTRAKTGLQPVPKV